MVRQKKKGMTKKRRGFVASEGFPILNIPEDELTLGDPSTNCEISARFGTTSRTKKTNEKIGGLFRWGQLAT